ncbi:hypothetical protein CC1G_01307 [Coprinopsis cinerea okayama7|uniref:KOW domain-containing protein n=1 Tax=Coprinopsis cinerea (strain Okayama-7 / 130 / ATCC MYA-4618 / FGSC 9003) TaxID=240176 RepID=A8NYC8_COPC7|nr:hypothetical protein CC1G_01307 [Coprinopsis cinerea okayama7\|eukprot:XP_001837395.1 hypothetical protein CC1G_01307 [Coprinopsis cinerea okayama7\
MSLKYFTRRAAIDATTTSPYLTNFNHLLPIPKAWRHRRSLQDPKLKSVRTRDRIRCWNIVPGDQIRLRGDKSNTLHEVLSINRLSNRVFVKGAVNTSDSDVTKNKNYHYSRCQLFVGNYEFPSESGIGKEVKPVFAERVSATRARWNYLQGRFAWTRFATKTTPRVPWEEKDIVIPWPKPEKPTLPDPTNYDTPREVVAQLTYQMPRFSQSMLGPVPRPPSEQDFLTSLYNPGYTVQSLEGAPLEVYLNKELSNPHARAKKQRRWQLRRANERARFLEAVQEELKHPDGRTEREIKAEVAHRLRQEKVAEQKAVKKMRWKNRIGEVNMIRKARKQAQKEERQRRRLTELSLEDSDPNQVIPKSL